MIYLVSLDWPRVWQPVLLDSRTRRMRNLQNWSGRVFFLHGPARYHHGCRAQKPSIERKSWANNGGDSPFRDLRIGLSRDSLVQIRIKRLPCRIDFFKAM